MSDSIPLSDAIAQLRAELAAALAEGEGKDLRLTAESIELELTVGLTAQGDAEARVGIWTVLTLGAKASAGRETTHRLMLTLKPHLSRTAPGTPVDLSDRLGSNE